MADESSFDWAALESEHLADVTWVTYPDVGHLPMEENTAQFNADLLGFLIPSGASRHLPHMQREVIPLSTNVYCNPVGDMAG